MMQRSPANVIIFRQWIWLNACFNKMGRISTYVAKIERPFYGWIWVASSLQFSSCTRSEKETFGWVLGVCSRQSGSINIPRRSFCSFFLGIMVLQISTDCNSISVPPRHIKSLSNTNKKCRESLLVPIPSATASDAAIAGIQVSSC